jgi:nitric oxide reductase NorD protein
VLQKEDFSGSVAWHKEWDCNLQDYLHSHVRVRDKFLTEKESDFYKLTLKHHRGLVKRIRYAFELLKPEGLIRLRQWLEGDEFDYRALLDFALDKKAGRIPSDRLYIKHIKKTRDVAVLLLVDLSRSTANTVFDSHATVLDVEKEAIVLFCEALGVVGDAFAIAGFSGTGRLGVDYFRIKDIDEHMDDTVKRRINAMAPQRSTRMGAAIRHATRHLEKISSKVRLLIILSDGFPNDLDYKQNYATEDTRKAIFEARSKNIHAHAITVNFTGDPKLDDLYGNVHHNVISDVRELPDKLLRIYGTLTRH